MSHDNLQKKSFCDFTKDPDTLSSVHQQDNDDRFCTRGRKCARTRNASSQPNDVIEFSSGSEGEDECIMSNSTSSVSGSAAAAAKLLVSTSSLDSTQDHHDFAGDMCARSSRDTSRSGGFASGGPPISPSMALAKELAHGCNQFYPSKEDTSKDLVFAKGMAKDDDQHDIFDTLSSVKSKRSLSLFSAPSSSRAKKSKVKINSSSHLGLGTSPEVWDQAVRNFLSASSKSFTERSSYYDGSNVGSHHAGEYL